MPINPTYFTLLSALLFSIGMLGIFLNRRSIIIILMSIELLLLSVNINLVAFSAFHQNITGQIFTMFVLTVAAAEAAIGLAILVVFFRNKGSIKVEDTQQLKGIELPKMLCFDCFPRNVSKIVCLWLTFT